MVLCAPLQQDSDHVAITYSSKKADVEQRTGDNFLHICHVSHNNYLWQHSFSSLGKNTCLVKKMFYDFVKNVTLFLDCEKPTALAQGNGGCL